MFTIEPRPASAMRLPNACVAVNVPTRFTSIVVRKSSVGTSSTRKVREPAAGGWSMPALLTSTSGAPCLSATASSAARSMTSAVSSSPARRSPSRMSTPTTRAPAFASASVQTGPRFPSAPVTIASRPSSGRSAVMRGAGLGQLPGVTRQRLFQQLERQRLVLRHGMPQRAADEPVQLVRRKAVARRLHRDVIGAQRVPGGKSRLRHELLGHLLDGLDLARVHRLRPVAKGLLRAGEVADHLAQALRLEREAVIGALQRAVQ